MSTPFFLCFWTGTSLSHHLVMRDFWNTSFLNAICIYANFIKHNRHFMSTYFLLDPFEFPYYFYRIRGELIFVIVPPVMMAQSRAESTRDTYNYGQYINRFLFLAINTPPSLGNYFFILKKYFFRCFFFFFWYFCFCFRRFLRSQNKP